METGGAIRNNRIGNPGGTGVFVIGTAANVGTFTMNDGHIYGNTATNAAASTSSGVHLGPGSALNMTGGEIHSNATTGDGGGILP